MRRQAAATRAHQSRRWWHGRPHRARGRACHREVFTPATAARAGERDRFDEDACADVEPASAASSSSSIAADGVCGSSPSPPASCRGVRSRRSAEGAGTGDHSSCDGEGASASQERRRTRVSRRMAVGHARSARPGEDCVIGRPRLRARVAVVGIRTRGPQRGHHASAHPWHRSVTGCHGLRPREYSSKQMKNALPSRRVMETHGTQPDPKTLARHAPSGRWKLAV